MVYVRWSFPDFQNLLCHRSYRHALQFWRIDGNHPGYLSDGSLRKCSLPFLRKAKKHLKRLVFWQRRLLPLVKKIGLWWSFSVAKEFFRGQNLNQAGISLAYGRLIHRAAKSPSPSAENRKKGVLNCAVWRKFIFYRSPMVVFSLDYPQQYRERNVSLSVKDSFPVLLWIIPWKSMQNTEFSRKIFLPIHRQNDQCRSPPDLSNILIFPIIRERLWEVQVCHIRKKISC